jgi:hypothetical protein
MRLCKTVEVESFKDMKTVLPVGMSIVHTLGFNRYLANILHLTREKPFLEPVALDYDAYVIRLNNTAVATEEFLRTEKALDALLGTLRLALDAIEAYIWYLIFSGGFVFWPPVITTGANFSYRELLALGRAAVHRIAGTENVHVLVPVIHYAAMLMDNTTGITPSAQSAVTEHHLYDAPKATIIPVAHNTSYFIHNVTDVLDFCSHDSISFYPDYLPSLIVRYVYEEVSVEKVNETSNNRNLRRVVLGRYLAFEFPLVYNNGVLPAMPVVRLNASNALTNTMNKFANGFNNISAIAAF